MRKFVLATAAAAFVLAAGGLLTATPSKAQQRQTPPAGATQDETTSGTSTPMMGSGMRGQGMMGQQNMMGQQEMMDQRRMLRQQAMRDRWAKHRAGRHARRMHRGPVRMVFFLIDTNGDQTLSLDEVQAVSARLFRYADANGDGQLTLKEVRSFMRGVEPRGRNRGDEEKDEDEE